MLLHKLTCVQLFLLRQELCFASHMFKAEHNSCKQHDAMMEAPKASLVNSDFMRYIDKRHVVISRHERQLFYLGIRRLLGL